MIRACFALGGEHFLRKSTKAAAHAVADDGVTDHRDDVDDDMLDAVVHLATDSRDSGGGQGGGQNTSGQAGTVNTGGGAGGGSSSTLGGSGVVIISYDSTKTISIPAGLTHNQTTSGGNRIVTFTAGTGTVSWL